MQSSAQYGAVRPHAGLGNGQEGSRVKRVLLAFGTAALALTLLAAYNPSQGPVSEVPTVSAERVAGFLKKGVEMLADAPAAGFVAKFYYIGKQMADIPSFPATPNLIKTTDKLDFDGNEALQAVDPSIPLDFLAAQFEGSITIEKAGEYTFQTESHDGSKVYIDGKQVVDNSGAHGPETRSASVYLAAGEHVLSTSYFLNKGGEGKGKACRDGGVGIVLQDAKTVDIARESVRMMNAFSKSSATVTGVPDISTFDDKLRLKPHFAIIPEQEKGSVMTHLSPSDRRAIVDYVEGGGILIIAFAGASRSVDLANELFGWTLAGSSCSTTKQTDDVDDSCYKGADESIPYLNAVRCVVQDSLPEGAISYYQDDSGDVSVFEVEVGHGKVVGLSPDWYDTSEGWDEVLRRSIQSSYNPPAKMVLKYSGPDTEGEYADPTATHISCGGSTLAASCGSCPGNERTCAGDCAWADGKCGAAGDSPVSCGGHMAPSCKLCPSGHASAWCNGECAWLHAACYPKGTTLLEDSVYLGIKGELSDEDKTLFLEAVAQAFGVEVSDLALVKADAVPNIGGYTLTFTVAVHADKAKKIEGSDLEGPLNTALKARGLPEIPFLKKPSIIPPEIAKYLEESQDGNFTFPYMPTTDEDWDQWRRSKGMPEPCDAVPTYEEGPHGEKIATYHPDCSMKWIKQQQSLYLKAFRVKSKQQTLNHKP